MLFKTYKKLLPASISVVSPYKLMGLLLQVAGMAVMVFAFLTLVGGLQSTLSHVTTGFAASSGVIKTTEQKCDPKTDEFCGVDVTKDGAIESVFSKRVYTFIFWLGAGIVLLFMGLLMRASEEVGHFFSSLPEREKMKERQKVGIGKVGWGGQF